MKNKKFIIRTFFNLYRILPGWILLQFVSSERKNIIFEEMEHWSRIKNLGFDRHFDIFSELMVTLPEYRSLLEYRCGSGIVKYALRALFPPMSTLYIVSDDIGPRLFIQHGYATGISAKKVGSDCWINQEVTIGYKSTESDPPVIGNGVRITAGAKVLGNITVGDNSVIAANAVVIKDVPPNVIVGGIPAKIIGERK